MLNKYTGKKVLVTGGAGFIGRYFVEELLKCRADVTAIDNNLRAYNIHKGANYIEGDIRNPDFINSVTKGKEIVFHLASLLGTSELFGKVNKANEVNIIGAVNILEACRKYDVDGILFPTKVNREDWLNPYTITKQASENYCKMYCREYGMKAYIGRWYHIYGKYQRWKVVHKITPTFITKALNNEPIPVYGNGEQTVDLMYASDLAKCAIKHATVEKVAGRVIDIGTGVEIKVVDLAKKIIKMTKSKSEISFRKMRKGEPPYSRIFADPTDMINLIGFKPKIDLDKGLTMTIPHYKNLLHELCGGGQRIT